MAEYYKVVLERNGKLISSWIDNQHAVEYKPGEFVRSSNGTPLFVFTKLDTAIEYASQWFSSEYCQIWDCEIENLIADKTYLFGSLNRMSLDQSKMVWDEILDYVSRNDIDLIEGIVFSHDSRVWVGWSHSVLVEGVKLTEKTVCMWE